ERVAGAAARVQPDEHGETERDDDLLRQAADAARAPPATAGSGTQGCRPRRHQSPSEKKGTTETQRHRAENTVRARGGGQRSRARRRQSALRAGSQKDSKTQSRNTGSAQTSFLPSLLCVSASLWFPLFRS